MGGGVAALAFHQASGMAQTGHELQIVVPPKAGAFAAAPNVQLSVIENAKQPKRRLLPFAKKLLQLAAEHDVIYSPTYRGFGVPCMVAGLLRRKPYIIYLHGTEVITEQKSWPRRKVMHRVLKNAAAILTNSHNTRNLVLGSFALEPANITAIHPGADVERFTEAHEVEQSRAIRSQMLERFPVREDDAVIFLTIARMSRQKGVHLVLEALAAILKDDPQLPLIYAIAGDGPDLPFFKSEAQRLDLSGNTLFVGNLSLHEVAPHYLASDVYVQPSQPEGDFLESFGISFVEAQAAGLPCIASDWGGVPEAVKDGESAFLVKLGDADALKNAMLELATNKQLRQTMGAAGRTNALRFSWNRHVRELEQQLQRAVDHK